MCCIWIQSDHYRWPCHQKCAALHPLSICHGWFSEPLMFRSHCKSTVAHQCAIADASSNRLFRTLASLHRRNTNHEFRHRYEWNYTVVRVFVWPSVVKLALWILQCQDACEHSVLPDFYHLLRTKSITIDTENYCRIPFCHHFSEFEMGRWWTRLSWTLSGKRFPFDLMCSAVQYHSSLFRHMLSYLFLLMIVYELDNSIGNQSIKIVRRE